MRCSWGHCSFHTESPEPDPEAFLTAEEMMGTILASRGLSVCVCVFLCVFCVLLRMCEQHLSQISLQGVWTSEHLEIQRQSRCHRVACQRGLWNGVATKLWPLRLSLFCTIPRSSRPQQHFNTSNSTLYISVKIPAVSYMLTVCILAQVVHTHTLLILSSISAWAVMTWPSPSTLCMLMNYMAVVIVFGHPAEAIVGLIKTYPMAALM